MILKCQDSWVTPSESVYPEIDTRCATEVEREVQGIYMALFPHGSVEFVGTAFDWALACFEGRYPGFQPIDARYHDLEHTLQGTLCLARLLHGRQLSGVRPLLDQRTFELTLLAILLHDTGYLKVLGDNEGTGAKYTLIHVNRSAEFAAVLLAARGFSSSEICAVQNMIRCTGVNVDLSAIPFQCDLEQTCGFALGTSDLLGQMAASDYVDKLPILFSEFAESAAHSGGRMTTGGSFASAEDLMQKTPAFWSKYVLPKLDRDFLGVHHFLKFPYPDGPNEYVSRIEANIQQLMGRMER